MASRNAEMRPIIRALEDRGYQVTKSNNGHLLVQNDRGKRVYSLPSTPGRGRAMQNLRSTLKRKGLIA